MNESTLRVLHITEMLSAAGIESFIMNMYRNIDRNKVQFDFLVLRNQKEFYDDEVKKLGGRKYYVHSKKNNTWMRILDEANTHHSIFPIQHTSKSFPFDPFSLSQMVVYHILRLFEPK